MATFVRARLAFVLLMGLIAGCSMSPTELEATRQAWETRDRERALECAQRGGRYFSSSCLYGGGP